MTNNIIYEHPLNERNRIFMRLEDLFNKIDYFFINKSSFEILIIIQTLIEIINLMERNDISADLIKELDRYQSTFNKLLDVSNVNKEALTSTINELEEKLNNMQNNFGNNLKLLHQDKFLSLIRQKITLSNNLSNFDIPVLYYWLNQNNNLLQLKQWLEKLDPIKDSIKLILQLIRESHTFTTQIANCGFYQTSFKHNTYYQLIRISLPNDLDVFPEISGNKHRITVRFLTCLEQDERPKQTNEDISFKLSCCYL